MHILLTDILGCPRCGPAFGLVLQADRIEDRRVVKGVLGCANCRHTYPVSAGLADLRATPDEPPLEVAPPDQPADAGERALRLAALLGITAGGGSVLLVGGDEELALGVSGLLSGVEVVAALSGAEGREGEAGEGVSWLATGRRLPFRDRAVRGVAVAGRPGPSLVAEGLRVLAPGGRIVVEQTDDTLRHSLEVAGAGVLLYQEGVMVAGCVG